MESSSKIIGLLTKANNQIKGKSCLIYGPHSHKATYMSRYKYYPFSSGNK